MMATTKKEVRRWKVMVNVDEEGSEELSVGGTRIWQEWSKLEEQGLDTWWRGQVDEAEKRETNEEAEEKASMKFEEAYRDLRYEKS